MIDLLIEELDKLPGNNKRKNYLERIIRDPNVDRHDLKRIACITLIEGNFIENYYKVTLFQQIINNLKKLKLGIMDIQRTWKMAQKNLSPRYTTDLNQIIKVKAWI